MSTETKIHKLIDRIESRIGPSRLMEILKDACLGVSYEGWGEITDRPLGDFTEATFRSCSKEFPIKPLDGLQGNQVAFVF